MKKLLFSLMIAVAALSVTITDADARRLGGGGSFGRQSQSVTRQALPPARQAEAPRPASPAATPSSVQPRPASPWRGMLGGALLGLGLGALFSHFGMGGAMAGLLSSILTIGLLVLAVVFVMRLVRGKAANHNNGIDNNLRPAYPDNGYARSSTPEIGSRLNPTSGPFAAATPVASSGTVHQPWGVPADFDVNAFVRQAKTYYIRLQAAWDRADINDISEFTTPEMFAELRMQIQERGASTNHTDVVSLDADLLGIETLANDYLASVRFSGMIREAEGAPAEPFSEVWNLSKPLSGQGGWVLAGIQQLANS